MHYNLAKSTWMTHALALEEVENTVQDGWQRCFN